MNLSAEENSLIDETAPHALERLDAQSLKKLQTRLRNAREKNFSLLRRQGAARVEAEGGRGAAAPAGDAAAGDPFSAAAWVAPSPSLASVARAKDAAAGASARAGRDVRAQAAAEVRTARPATREARREGRGAGAGTGAGAGGSFAAGLATPIALAGGVRGGWDRGNILFFSCVLCGEEAGKGACRQA